MEEEIKKAITLLKNNGYFVTKIPKNLCDNAKECSETGHGECTDCVALLALSDAIFKIFRENRRKETDMMDAVKSVSTIRNFMGNAGT